VPTQWRSKALVSVCGNGHDPDPERLRLIHRHSVGRRFEEDRSNTTPPKGNQDLHRRGGYGVNERDLIPCDAPVFPRRDETDDVLLDPAEKVAFIDVVAPEGG